MNIMLALILIVNVCVLGLLVFAGFKIRAAIRQFQDFLTAPDEKTPSALTQSISVISDMFGRAVAASLKAAFMGKQSGDVRAEQAVMGDIVKDSIDQTSPLLGGILQSFPSLQKTLRRNPALLDLAISKLAGITGGSPGSSGGNHTNSQVKFKL